jgi:hypothetical protein
METRLETTDLLETITGSPSEHKPAQEEQNKIKEKEEQIGTQKLLIQQVKYFNKKKTNERFKISFV